MTTMNLLGPSQSTLLIDESVVSVQKAHTAAVASQHLVKVAKKHKDDDEARPDQTNENLESVTDDSELSVGNESYVMLADNDGGKKGEGPSDDQMEAIIQQVSDIVLNSNGHLNKTDEEMISHIADGMEDFDDFTASVKELALKASKHALALTKAGLHTARQGARVAIDRITRIQGKLVFAEQRLHWRKGDHDNATFVLPKSARRLALNDHEVKGYGDVLNALSKAKWLFTLIHNDYQTYQALYKTVLEARERADAMEALRQYLKTLAARSMAKEGPSNTYTLTNFPGFHTFTITLGESFGDNEVGFVKHTGKLPSLEPIAQPTTQQLAQVLGECAGFIKVINEFYGRISSRLAQDFKALEHEIAQEERLVESAFEARMLTSATRWFLEHQTKLFQRALDLSLDTVSAAADFCIAAFGAKVGSGNEALLLGHVEYAQGLEALNTAWDEAKAGLQDTALTAQVLSVLAGHPVFDAKTDVVLLAKDYPTVLPHHPFDVTTAKTLFSDAKAKDRLTGLSAIAVQHLWRTIETLSRWERVKGDLGYCLGRLSRIGTNNTYSVHALLKLSPLCGFLHLKPVDTLTDEIVKEALLNVNHALLHATDYLDAGAARLRTFSFNEEVSLTAFVKALRDQGATCPGELALTGGFSLKRYFAKGCLKNNVHLGIGLVNPLPEVGDCALTADFINEFGKLPELSAGIHTQLVRLDELNKSLAITTTTFLAFVNSVLANINTSEQFEQEAWVKNALTYISLFSTELFWGYDLLCSLANYENCTLSAIERVYGEKDAHTD